MLDSKSCGMGLSNAAVVAVEEERLRDPAEDQWKIRIKIKKKNIIKEKFQCAHNMVGFIM